jgi:hypothetical protein
MRCVMTVFDCCYAIAALSLCYRFALPSLCLYIIALLSLPYWQYGRCGVEDDEDSLCGERVCCNSTVFVYIAMLCYRLVYRYAKACWQYVIRF